ncbi:MULTISPECIES: DUF2626 domain-containing protein [Brevibacillus]|jgi:hypothetical protein|uniref:DUF2626 domain-containing protein n=2 Tax=Brevibacillus borstelensis TaxID=45462 RepID=M8DLM5_9BACL|nr:DUF2626 domain-containing protein [Brevibacillus borstelensis]EMT54523.1 hypothetical protein I532_02925 [Brevibacillus borstelensis AK1]KKX54374.1 membrane protein [Brevibacillus borstelensis cifa_chp40]MBE5395921.1 DUF2626 domain-containing protein [Brevibacillus borstelensis]MCC0563259.1 DUF2626 domain-containing protein [Brevibacillus borstelensis]MCM3471268.1 DUF2626 domain-containing protein [Brevibacillus borstelensis]
MDRMYRVLGFWTIAIALMSFWAGLYPMALLFFGLTAFFVALSYMNLTERAYLNIFFGFMFVSFVGFTYYTFFVMPVGPQEHSMMIQSFL